MRNEKGITLVELLAALAILGIITAVIMSVLLTGTSSADRTSSKQQMQQEANLIVEKIRSEYLDKDVSEIRIKVLEDKNELWLNSEIISQGYDYNIIEAGNCTAPVGTTSEYCINPSENVNFKMLLEKGENLKFTIETTFSKLR